MTWQTLGLAIYVTVSVVTIPVLLLDLWLAETGHTMMTDYCRAHPWAAYLVLMAVASGLIGLAVHLMAPVQIERRP